MSADNVLGWEIVLKISHLPSKLRFLAKYSFFGQSLSREHYQPSERVYLLNNYRFIYNLLKAFRNALIDDLFVLTNRKFIFISLSARKKLWKFLIEIYVICLWNLGNCFQPRYWVVSATPPSRQFNICKPLGLRISKGCSMTSFQPRS